MPISVKTSVFEGPLELLSEPIEKRKLLISDISLSSVADEFMARVGAMDELPVGETADFVALAATLLLIKSRSLLPSLSLSDEEEHDIKELEYRLAAYQIIKDSARGLLQARAPVLWEGLTFPEPMYIPDESVTLKSLRTAAQLLIDGFPQILALPEQAVKKIISLEETIEKMATRISSAFKMSFKEFAQTPSVHGTSDVLKHSVILSFLALLELVKQGMIKATQEREFGDIALESSAVGTPSYE